MRSNVHSHGAETPLSRYAIPESPTSQSPVLELRPPTLHLTKITPTSQSQTQFHFASPLPPHRPAPILSLSKSAPLSALEARLRAEFGLEGGEIRIFTFALKTPLEREIAPVKARELVDVENPVDTAFGSRTLGEVGIVSPLQGLAIEHHNLGESYPLDLLPPKPQKVDRPLIGRTLGAQPSPGVPRGRPSVRATVDSDEEGGVGVLPGSYPRTPETSPSRGVGRSISADRVERRPSLNLRVSSGLGFSREDRVRGTTGLNNLGNPPKPQFRLLGLTRL